MAYEPKTWECGETVTADALNHLEQGVAEAGGGDIEPLLINATSIGSGNGQKWIVTDKTYQQVADALENGIPCFVTFADPGNSICNATDVSDFTMNATMRFPVVFVNGNDGYVCLYLGVSQGIIGSLGSPTANDYLTTESVNCDGDI